VLEIVCKFILSFILIGTIEDRMKDRGRILIWDNNRLTLQFGKTTYKKIPDL